MRINAYIMAADPAWIETSVLSYYDHVDTIVVSYDESGHGWTGAPIASGECLERLRAIDSGNKFVFLPGNYSKRFEDAMESDTLQRQEALDRASEDADWVLQLDTDEVIPDPSRLLNELKDLDPEFGAVDWPMRTLFQSTSDGRFLEVCSLFRRTIGSYPGPIAIRAGSKLSHARQTKLKSWRCDVRAKDTDPAAGYRRVDRVIDSSAAVLHFSWVRTEAEIRRKLQSWGHSAGFDGEAYLSRIWNRAPKFWWTIHRFHPLEPRWWPALKPVSLPGHLRKHVDVSVVGNSQS